MGASRGFIRKEHIRQWTKLEPRLPVNLEDIQSAEEITRLLEVPQQEEEEEEVNDNISDAIQCVEDITRYMEKEKEDDDDDDDDDDSMNEIQESEEESDEIEKNMEKDGDEDEIADENKLNVCKGKMRNNLNKERKPRKINGQLNLIEKKNKKKRGRVALSDSETEIETTNLQSSPQPQKKKTKTRKLLNKQTDMYSDTETEREIVTKRQNQQRRIFSKSRNTRITTENLKKEMTVSIKKRFGEDIHEVKLNQDLTMIPEEKLNRTSIGQCIFNTDGRKTKKLTTLNDSIKRMVNKMKENPYIRHSSQDNLAIVF